MKSAKIKHFILEDNGELENQIIVEMKIVLRHGYTNLYTQQDGTIEAVTVLIDIFVQHLQVFEQLLQRCEKFKDAILKLVVFYQVSLRNVL